MGSAPFLGGGFGHFYAYAPTKIEYAIDRYAMEVKRQLDVLDRRLADNEFLAGSEYTIADMATWPWYGALAKGLVYGAGEFLSVHEYKNVQRWTDAIAKRPAVKRGRMVNRISGDPASQLHERHDASDFDTKTQDKIGEPRRREAVLLTSPRCGERSDYATKIRVRGTLRESNARDSPSPRPSPRKNGAREIKSGTHRPKIDGETHDFSKRAPFASIMRKPAPASRCF